MPAAEGGVAVGMEPRLPTPLSFIKLKGGRWERERGRGREVEKENGGGRRGRKVEKRERELWCEPKAKIDNRDDD